MRLEPYETMTVGLIQEADGNEYDREATFKAVKAQVEVWIEEAKDAIKKGPSAG